MFPLRGAQVTHVQPAEPATNPAAPGGAPAGLPGRGARVGTGAPVGRPATGARIVALDCYDVRFPTSLEHDGSDAMNSDPDYSAAYAVLRTDAEGLEGHALCFTIGRGNDVVVAAIATLRRHVVGQYVDDLIGDLGRFSAAMIGDSQLRWLGPEEGVMRLATGAGGKGGGQAAVGAGRGHDAGAAGATGRLPLPGRRAHPGRGPGHSPRR